jgi:restriction endonuclease S subunit
MNWKEIKFADFLKERKGLLEPNNTKLFNYKKIDKIDFAKGNLFLTEYSPTKTKQIIVYPNDFIFSGLNIEKGAVTINTTGERLVVSANYSTCEVDYSVIDMDFFLLFMKSLSFKNLLKENLKKDYGFTRPKHLEQIKFFIPSSLEEQRNLVKLANKNTQVVNEISTEINHQINFTKKLRQQLLQDAVQGKLVEQYKKDESANELLKKIKAEKQKLISEKKLKKEKELPPIKPEEIPFEIPENWVWCRLGEIAYITSGSTPSQTAFVESGIPYLKMYNLRNQKIDFFHKPQYIKEEVHNGQLKRCRAYSGDIIMNIVGPPLGKIAIIPDDLPECNFNQAAVLIRPLKKEMNHFIFWYLNELSEIRAIETKGVAGQDNISVTQAHNMRVPLPPFAEQNRIVQKLDELMQYCNELESSIKQSESQNEKLLQQVLREALRKDIVGV